MSGKLANSRIGRRASRSGAYRVIKQRGVEIGYLLTLFTLSAGIFNTLLEGSKPEFAGRIILPFRAAQNFTEFLINFFTILVGTGGIYLIYLSGKQAFKYRTANLYLLLGFTVLVTAVIMGLLTLQTKGF